MTSDQMVVEAPMSFTGSAKRIWRKSESSLIRLLFLAPTIGVVWLLVAVWYLFFGLWLVPWRLIRRGSRRRKIEEARHAEMIEALARTEHLRQQGAAAEAKAFGDGRK